jgi:hypothetical protein
MRFEISVTTIWAPAQSGAFLVSQAQRSMAMVAPLMQPWVDKKIPV